MTNINKLKSFLAAAENLNFSKAAVELHISQPTISHHIKSLENELGAVLFERTSTGIILTEAGKFLMSSARKMVIQSNEMYEMMASLQTGIVGQLNIACSTTAGKYVLPQLAARFCHKFPKIKIRILACMSEFVSQHLLEEEVNLGVVSSEIINQTLEYQEFFKDSMHLIVPGNHPWASREYVEPDDLSNEPIIMRESISGTRRVLMSQLAQHDIGENDLNIFLELGNAEAIVRTVASGYGVSFVSSLASFCQEERGMVVRVPVKGLQLVRMIYMVRKKLTTPNRPQDVFWSFTHDEANKDLLNLPEMG